ncbi:acyl-CoA carboxylase subunit beta [Vineibacter terrae]|uniref:acyl-CoA carboxylase subunit beta n=1 Tax=Vineibacter terrae TaxID=2586908 RepID=UPI002E32DB96|nr:carboxyl transferase domain-containing protein [Vineibacter terrae]HEX2886401.1 carboxyl transferase domain-containing protein [Vineibacter terrae]
MTVMREAPAMQALLETVQAARADVLDAKRPDAVARQRKRGKLTARERITRLCDAESFREVGGLVQPMREGDGGPDLKAPADGIVTGTGRIDGRPVTIVASDYTALGGSIGQVGRQKMLRAMRRAGDTGMPFIMLHDGGGHRIQDGQDARTFSQGTPVFDLFAQLSGWVPVVSAVMGPAFAGPTNYSAMADFVVMVRDHSAMGMAGPALVKAGIGEDIGMEALGGASMHVDTSGIAHLATPDEDACLASVRAYLSYLPSNAGQSVPIAACDDPEDRREEWLLDSVPTNLRKGYDMRRIIAAIADKGSVLEIRPTFARNIVVCFARLAGRPVGFIANQPLVAAGMIDVPASEKAAHFIAVCDAFGLPLIYLIDVPGNAIGSAAERAGLGRRSGRMLFELGCATVPRLSVVLRRGYGGAFIMMNGGQPSFGAEGSFIWPSAEICAMSVEGSVDVAYRSDYANAPDPAARRQALIDGIRRNLGPLRAAAHFHIDDVIDPRDTRPVLIRTLADAPARRPARGYPRHRAISPI